MNIHNLRGVRAMRSRPNRRERRRPHPVLSMLALAGIILAGCHQGLDKTTQVPGRAGGTFYGVGRSSAPSKLAASEPPAIPGALPSAHEELWVIGTTRSVSNPSGAPAVPANPASTQAPEPSSGALCTRVNDELVPLPLRHTAVEADLAGYIASVQVVQHFQNPSTQKIEAIYVFPLPENAAVTDFMMTLGDRRIRGIIRERGEAERIYGDARAQGHVASLLAQERPNIFTQAVANLEPGRALDITLRYFHTLAADDGWYEFVFPMVVGPRFNPASIDDGIGAVGRGAQGLSGQKREVTYLAPSERSGHDIALRVKIDGGMPIEEVLCPSHRTVVEREAPERVGVTLATDDTIPNKDFVLRYRLAGDRIKSSLLTHRDARGGYFTLMLHPPADQRGLSRSPLELVFVLDCSGSMSGEPLTQAKAAIRHGLQRLQAGDTFQIINFSERSSALGPHPVEAEPANIRRGLAYLDTLNSDGPTQMIEGIKAALQFRHDPGRLRFVCFLTDGYIGNERQILTAVENQLGASRLFSFGVGSSPNRFLLDGLARLGRGAVTYVGLRDDAGAVMNAFFDRIQHPALTDLRIDWGGMAVSEVYPSRLPDLFVGRPIIVTGRFDGTPTGPRVLGVAAGRQFAISVAPPGQESSPSHPALPAVWARMKIASWSDPLRDGDGALAAETVRKLALDYNLVSAFTAFVAVDAAHRTPGEPGVAVPVAVPVPEGVSSKRTVKSLNP